MFLTKGYQIDALFVVGSVWRCAPPADTGAFRLTIRRGCGDLPPVAVVVTSNKRSDISSHIINRSATSERICGA